MSKVSIIGAGSIGATTAFALLQKGVATEIILNEIKQEKSLVITAVPNSNRAEVFIRGNEELTGFSTVRVKVVAENGMFDTYSIDIKKDAFNKTIEIASIIAGCVIILFSSCIIILRKKNRARREYFEE